MHPFSAYLHGFAFTGRVGEIVARTPGEVLPAFEELQRQLAAGLHAAGFVCYEAAGALNDALTTPPAHQMPLLWFGLFTERNAEPFPLHQAPFRCSDWQTNPGWETYRDSVQEIRELIAAGDSYQVNYTMRQRFTFSGCSRSFFSELCRNQPTPYNSYIECGRWRLLSASPELFFSLSGGRLVTRPMKGTAPRGRWYAEDLARKERLRQSPKDVAENLMIVDLLRNDMGMVSRTGSVQVSSLFDVESHPTVHQMTSTIESRVGEGVSPLELFRALFPCGSVTGAPKRRSMEIIAGLEGEPRGLYTGCLGYFSPGGEAQFSVAIRTAVLDRETGRGEIGIGSGITYDSQPEAEYQECLDKRAFVAEQRGEFHLIESLLHDEQGYFLLERHLERLERSARYFSFPLAEGAPRRVLEETAVRLTPSARHKVRLMLFEDGRLSCEAAPLPEAMPEAKAAFARQPVSSADPFLYHKTSRRDLLHRELAARPDLDEVIFENERGELTEGAYSNLVAVIDGRKCTPPLGSGLLPGTLREELLAQGMIEERILKREDLARADAVFLVNSVRRWRQVTLVP
ncbi:aminodeoxychorismate synthase component I [Geomonas nitrogeniifigens]|uniref:Aminodeoxychorismate synthase component I n=1 Tax=Geomonas diazotrophica TaxID=2843197 RepID=A0ABX8JKY7_9BACT|nr:aminodeoxychorismate synthase component I [Geomonas nitrogeniifigens]QWV97781.1 aminodeoxychorismate synthase component I [Geomonas nitrogeniifigens]QXE86921.1 aminodeoxychorismate synthase component I [Geomonas nitrogeniifigens]